MPTSNHSTTFVSLVVAALVLGVLAYFIVHRVIPDLHDLNRALR